MTPKRRTGRRGFAVSIYLTPEANELLEEIMEHTGESASEVIRRGIELYHASLFRNTQVDPEVLFMAIEQAAEILNSALKHRARPPTELSFPEDDV